MKNLLGTAKDSLDFAFSHKELVSSLFKEFAYFVLSYGTNNGNSLLFQCSMHFYY